MVLIATLTSIGLATLLSLLGWALNKVVTGFDARLGSFDARLDRFDARLDRFDARLDRFENSLSTLRSDMNSEFKEVRADMEAQNKELRADIASLREDHIRLEGKMDGLLATKTD